MAAFQNVLAVATIAISWSFGAGWAADLPPASGQVILTVAGEIKAPNRQAFDEFEDPFTNYHDRKFDKAAEFDLAMLEGLGMHEVEVNYDGWPRPIRLAGPFLADVLDAVGAEPSLLTVLALDGFAVELTKQDLAGEDWIVAIQIDGEYMNLGQRGPAWIVFDPGEDKSITADEEGTWPWAAFFMQVD